MHLYGTPSSPRSVYSGSHPTRLKKDRRDHFLQKEGAFRAKQRETDASVNVIRDVPTL